MSWKKLLIIAPHPDDEIFVLRKLPISKDNLVTILFLSGNQQRSKEAYRSCEYLGFYPLMLEDEGLRLIDGLFHEQLAKLTEKLFIICRHYDLVFCPALEGGHQDHDTTALACLISIQQLEKEDCVMKFYPCYTSWKETALYKVASSSSYLKLMKKERVSPKACNKHQYYLAFRVYTSQVKTWLLIYPFLFLRQIFNQEEFLYIFPISTSAPGLSIVNALNQRPLYESHSRLTLEEWKRSYLNGYHSA